ncbi:MAG: leucyl/phenylalanyl-tRNA--protein transferase [Cellvibrionaceae bacterium]
MKLAWLDTQEPDFPETSQALSEPNGLLAAGGQLSVDWLLAAYQKGIFPWFNEDDPILWWTPSPRMVLYPHQLHISRSLRKALRKQDFEVTINRDFMAIIDHCAASRSGGQGLPETWITPEMRQAYIDLNQSGYAHSIEVWRDQQLIGGLYGIALGKVFFGESMFSKATNGSKIAISHLVEWLKQWQYKLIDCQVYNDHLSSLGAIEIDRHTFEQIIGTHASKGTLSQPKREIWTEQDITLPATHW